MKPRYLNLFPPICVSVLSIVCLWSSSGISSTTAGIESATSDAIADSMEPYTLPAGTWVMRDSNWAFAQDGPISIDDFSLPIPGEISTDKVTELDTQIMCLCRSMMSPVQTVDNRTIWTPNSAEFRGQAVTVRVGEEDVPIVAWLAWPAYDNLWSVVSAQRIQPHHESILQLPDDCSVIASRVAEDSTTNGQLIQLDGANLDLAGFLQLHGCAVRKIPDAQDRDVMQVTSGDKELLVTVFPAESDRRAALVQTLNNSAPKK